MTQITKEMIEAAALKADNEQLSKEHGMVHQVWQDGEITCQKSGDLLWQRSLHCFAPPVLRATELGLMFPHRHGGNSYAWVTSEDAHTIRSMIVQLLGG